MSNAITGQRSLTVGLPLLLLLLFADCLALRAAHTPLTEGSVALSEFFEEIHVVDVASGTIVDALNSDPFDAPFGQHIEVLDPDSIVITSFRELHRYDVATHQTSLITTLSSSFDEITRDGTGNLLVAGNSGILRVDPVTGAETPIYDAPLFSPRDLVVDDRGLIYVAEFFSGLAVIDPAAGTLRQIGDFSPNQFENLDIGPDGFLYLNSIFGGEFYRVHPGTGELTLLANDATAAVTELQVAADGKVLFGGRHETINGLFSLDPVTGVISTVVNGTVFGAGFFSVLDLDVYESNLRSSLPEPGTFALLLFGGCMSGLHGRRPRKLANS